MRLTLQTLNPDSHTLAKPYSSINIIPSNVADIMFIVIVTYALYIAFRVWYPFKKEKRNK